MYPFEKERLRYYQEDLDNQITNGVYLKACDAFLFSISSALSVGVYVTPQRTTADYVVTTFCWLITGFMFGFVVRNFRLQKKFREGIKNILQEKEVAEWNAQEISKLREERGLEEAQIRRLQLTAESTARVAKMRSLAKQPATLISEDPESKNILNRMWET